MPVAVITPAMWCLFPSSGLLTVASSSTQVEAPVCLTTLIWVLLNRRNEYRLPPLTMSAPLVSTLVALYQADIVTTLGICAETRVAPVSVCVLVRSKVMADGFSKASAAGRPLSVHTGLLVRVRLAAVVE